jgi:hypothetical protein
VNDQAHTKKLNEGSQLIESRTPGLPNCLFSIQCYSFATFWKALEWKMLLIFNDHLVYFVVICFILWQFGTHILWSIYPFCIKKNLATLSANTTSSKRVETREKRENKPSDQGD